MKRKERKRRSWHGFTGREESEGNYEMVQVKISGLEVTAVMIRVTELCTHAWLTSTQYEQKHCKVGIMLFPFYNERNWGTEVKYSVQGHKLESDGIRSKRRDFYSKVCDLNLCATLYTNRGGKGKLLSRCQGSQTKWLLGMIQPVSKPLPAYALKLTKVIFPRKWLCGVFSSTLLCWSPNKPTGLVVLWIARLLQGYCLYS